LTPRPPLDFFIIGAEKAGTTALWHMLGQLSSVFMPPVKELHYFVAEEFHEQGPAYLEPFYAGYQGEALVGGADVHMLFLPYAAQRLVDHSPGVRAVAVLRDPVERAWSAFWFAKALGLEDLDSFEEALEAETLRPWGEAEHRRARSYLSRGHYHAQLTRWGEVLGPQHVHVLLSEDLARDPKQTVRDLLTWLGESPPETVPVPRFSNESGVPRWGRIQRLAHREVRVKGLVRRVTTPALRLRVRQHLVGPLSRWNMRARPNPPMPPGVRARLNEHFRPHNERLAALLGRDLAHWST